MCYICEARGNVGTNYKATQKTIAGARRALGPTPKKEKALVGHCFGDHIDLTKIPRNKLWKTADLKNLLTPESRSAIL